MGAMRFTGSDHWRGAVERKLGTGCQRSRAELPCRRSLSGIDPWLSSRSPENSSFQSNCAVVTAAYSMPTVRPLWKLAGCKNAGNACSIRSRCLRAACPVTARAARDDQGQWDFQQPYRFPLIYGLSRRPSQEKTALNTRPFRLIQHAITVNCRTKTTIKNPRSARH